MARKYSRKIVGDVLNKYRAGKLVQFPKHGTRVKTPNIWIEPLEDMNEGDRAYLRTSGIQNLTAKEAYINFINGNGIIAVSKTKNDMPIHASDVLSTFLAESYVNTCEFQVPYKVNRHSCHPAGLLEQNGSPVIHAYVSVQNIGLEGQSWNMYENGNVKKQLYDFINHKENRKYCSYSPQYGWIFCNDEVGDYIVIDSTIHDQSFKSYAVIIKRVIDYPGEDKIQRVKAISSVITPEDGSSSFFWAVPVRSLNGTLDSDVITVSDSSVGVTKKVSLYKVIDTSENEKSKEEIVAGQSFFNVVYAGDGFWKRTNNVNINPEFGSITGINKISVSNGILYFYFTDNDIIVDI